MACNANICVAVEFVKRIELVKGITLFKRIVLLGHIEISRPGFRRKLRNHANSDCNSGFASTNPETRNSEFVKTEPEMTEDCWHAIRRHWWRWFHRIQYCR